MRQPQVVRVVRVVHSCGHSATYPRPANDVNGEIATGLALQPCWVCSFPGGDWMDVNARQAAERARKGTR